MGVSTGEIGGCGLGDLGGVCVCVTSIVMGSMSLSSISFDVSTSRSDRWAC